MKLAAVGDNCLDVYSILDKAFPGGNPVNVAVYFSRLGGESSYTGAVGNDEHGKTIINALREKKVDISHVKVLEGNTAVTQVDLVNGNRVFGDYDEGVLADFKLTEDDKDFIKNHDLMVSGFWGMIEKDIPGLKKDGMKIAFDFATKLTDPLVDDIITYVDYAFFSYESDDAYIREYLKSKKNNSAGLVIATLGENGSIVYNGKEFVKFGIVPCSVVDSMGAGDSYIAGFLKGVLEGKEIYECMKMGASSASVTLEYMGAW